MAFDPNADAGSIKAAALTLVFIITFLWVAWNHYNGADGRGLDWFSLFVAIAVVPMIIQVFGAATTTWDYWLAWCWEGWGVLWFLNSALLVLQKANANFVGAVTFMVGVHTGSMPGYSLPNGIPQ